MVISISAECFAYSLVETVLYRVPIRQQDVTTLSDRQLIKRSSH